VSDERLSSSYASVPSDGPHTSAPAIELRPGFGLEGKKPVPCWVQCWGQVWLCESVCVCVCACVDACVHVK
jgi:hypothetical protein